MYDVVYLWYIVCALCEEVGAYVEFSDRVSVLAGHMYYVWNLQQTWHLVI